MKKYTLYILAIITICLAACQGKEYDPKRELRDITTYWSGQYVARLLNKSIYVSGSDTSTVSTSLNDTISAKYKFDHALNNGDSVNMVSTLLQIGDSIVVTTQGYRYSDKFWAHLFTADSGIINFNGKFHVDFYETGKTTPWAWGEVTFSPIVEDGYYHYDNLPYEYDTEVGWY